MRKLLPAVAIIAFAWFAVSCGGGSDGIKVVVGVEGGVVTSGDGKLTLDIPAGALDAEVGITITAVSIDELPEELRDATDGPVYRLEPDGLVFDEPVPFTLELNRSELDDVPEDGIAANLLLTQDGDGVIEVLDELAIEATLGEETVTVSGELGHFSLLWLEKKYISVALNPVERQQLVGASFFTQGIVTVIVPGVIVTFSAGFFDGGTVSLTRASDAAAIEGVGARFNKLGFFQCGESPGGGIYGIRGSATLLIQLIGQQDVTKRVRFLLHAPIDCVSTLTTPPTATPFPDSPTPDVIATVAEELFATSTPAPTDTPVPGAPPPAQPTSKPAPATSTPAPSGVSLRISCEHTNPGVSSTLIVKVSGLAPGEQISGTASGPGIPNGPVDIVGTADSEGSAALRITIFEFGKYQVNFPSAGLSGSYTVGSVC